MDWLDVVKRVDADAARAFVGAARRVVEALLVEAEQVQQTQTPRVRDYERAALPREAPGGGWLSVAELRATAQRMTEAIAAEQWTDGFVAAVRLLAAVGAVL